MNDKYIIEVRDEQGSLDLKNEPARRKAHPYLFSKNTYSIDDLCHYMSYGQGRDDPKGPLDLPAFMKEIGITYRIKYW